MTRIARIASCAFGALGIVQLVLGTILATQSVALAHVNPILPVTGGSCILNTVACKAGTCTTAAVDCTSPTNCSCTN
jgi:hypothetical protein